MRISDWSSDVCSSDLGFVTTEDGANLLAGYKRAANILKKEGWDQPASQANRHPGLVSGSNVPQAEAPAESWTPEQVRHDGKGLAYTPEPQEAALIATLESRSEERRVGQARVSTCRSWCSPEH